MTEGDKTLKSERGGGGVLVGNRCSVRAARPNLSAPCWMYSQIHRVRCCQLRPLHFGVVPVSLSLGFIQFRSEPLNESSFSCFGGVVCFYSLVFNGITSMRDQLHHDPGLPQSSSPVNAEDGDTCFYPGWFFSTSSTTYIFFQPVRLQPAASPCARVPLIICSGQGTERRALKAEIQTRVTTVLW